MYYVSLEEILADKETMFSNGCAQPVEAVRISNIESKRKCDLVDRFSYEVVRSERDEAQKQVAILNMRTQFSFGDKCFYFSPAKDGLKTRCIFIRDEFPKAVIMFENAEFAARVPYQQLEK